MHIHLGLGVEGTDGPCGTVADAVIDPGERTVTHVVVEPRHGVRLGRLVPVERLERPVAGADLRIGCTSAELARYPDIEETDFLRLDELPAMDDGWKIGVSTVLAPSYDSSGYAGYPGIPRSDRMLIAYDRIPAGEVEIRQRSSVHASDGEEVGHVEGFLLDADGRITDLVVRRGHLRRRRDITIPIDAVSNLDDDRIELELTIHQVEQLPSVYDRRHQASPG